MNLNAKVNTKPKYRPQAQSLNPDVLINFELTQENTYLAVHRDYIKPKNTNFINDDDLVYSDNEAETSYGQGFINKHEQSHPISDSFVKNEHKVLSDCINLQNVTPQPSNQKGTKIVKYQESDLKLKLQSRIKTQDGGQQPTNKSSCFLTNRSVFFTNQTSRSILSSVRFNVKPKTSIKQIVQNAYKTERSRKGE